ncbi:nucleotide-binding protein [Burkholderia sp. AU33545]|uniref:TIR domain-containing protein n=1 Tax=Burkholderia sp. AU33545 TaxID=2879631 RepID=UPI001CF4665D|nr:TIR domain-containing protein [Burkholderia sp. AU33545]MCA8201864.1 nucleotide-binding protein [Burkholderia sp. AU33545]
MKPRAFIGSSVEGLNVAYAVQQNLVHQVETTVWDQGIFHLSSTTIESLTTVLNDVDFGIFVFSPDDIVNIRGESSASVRDNVLFEMGLFIGKLGRDRVFFLAPDNADIRVPTDLLGVTSGKFNADRQDGSMQAATGPACHQIRTQIAKLGPSNPEKVQTGEPEKPAQEEATGSWLYALIKDEFDEAHNKIMAEIDKSDENGKSSLLAWSLYIHLKKNRADGVGGLLKFAAEHHKDTKIQSLVMNFLTWEEHYADAISLHSKLDQETSSNPDVIKALAQCHIAAEHPQEAIGLLTSQNFKQNPEYTLIIAKIYQDDEKVDNAMDVLYEALEANPSHEQLRCQFAMLAMDKKMWAVALYLFATLKYDFPKNSDYWGYYGNCCLELDFYDAALTSYKRADELVDHKASWISGNIGNLFSNKGLPTEAIIHLKRATTLDENSQYAYDRMAGALKKREEEDRLLQKEKVNGKILFQSFADNRQKEESARFAELKNLSSAANS